MYENQTNQPPMKQTRCSPRLPRRIVGGLGFLTILSFSQPALAQVPPTFTIIDPVEFDLPVPEPGKGIGFFFQNTVYTDNNEAFDANRDDVDLNPEGNTLLGISRFGRLFSLESLPKLGWFWEYLQPEVYIETDDGNSITGLGDPLLALAVYINPAENLTLGFENFVSIPVGDNELSNHAFGYFPGFIFDYSLGPVGFDGTIGAGFRTDQKIDGNTIEQGTDFYADLRLRYVLNDWFRPFLAYDYATTSSSEFTRVADPTVSQAGDTIPSFDQHIAGAGTLLFIKPDQTAWITAWYDYGFDGRNTTRVNGLFTKFVWLFP